MRHTGLLVTATAMLSSVAASSPPMDSSSGVFAGEWWGTGPRGAYCYLNLTSQGDGWALIDGGAGDWSGAKIHWRNRRQSLEITDTVPLAASAPLRTLPLVKFSIRNEFNLSLKLTWGGASEGCWLQRAESTARRLEAARHVVDQLQNAQGTR